MPDPAHEPGHTSQEDWHWSYANLVLSHLFAFLLSLFVHHSLPFWSSHSPGGNAGGALVPGGPAGPGGAEGGAGGAGGGASGGGGKNGNWSVHVPHVRAQLASNLALSHIHGFFVSVDEQYVGFFAAFLSKHGGGGDVGGIAGEGGGAFGCGNIGGAPGGGRFGGRAGDCVHSPHSSVQKPTRGSDQRALSQSHDLAPIFAAQKSSPFLFMHGAIGGGGADGGIEGSGTSGGASGGVVGGGDVGGVVGGGGVDGSAMQPHDTAHFISPHASLLHRVGLLATLFAQYPSYFLVSA